MGIPRTIWKVFEARAGLEGPDARILRSIGSPSLQTFSPFLMLDHFWSAPDTGMGDHPHRGQETITYILQGAMEHEDFAGNTGAINEGDLQFMTAGRGIMHAEVARGTPSGGETIGLQLWVDLPKKDKLSKPSYRDLRSTKIPQFQLDDSRVNIKLISGESHGMKSVKSTSVTPVWIIDFKIKPGGRVTQEIPAGWNAFVYTIAGKTWFQNNSSAPIERFNAVIFDQIGQTMIARVDAGAQETSHFILYVGEPLDQDVMRYGPFVMNTQDELNQALIDFRSHKNGFEQSKNWESKIAKSLALNQ